MAFSQLSQLIAGGMSSSNNDNEEGQQMGQQMGLDSITLGQLKAMVGSAPKPKVRLKFLCELDLFELSLSLFCKPCCYHGTANLL
jgi:hypothetical protein